MTYNRHNRSNLFVKYNWIDSKIIPNLQKLIISSLASSQIERKRKKEKERERERKRKKEKERERRVLNKFLSVQISGFALIYLVY